MTIEESLARVQIESPHHGPIVAAEVTRLEARLASAERGVEALRGIAQGSGDGHFMNPTMEKMGVARKALAAHSAAKEPKP